MFSNFEQRKDMKDRKGEEKDLETNKSSKMWY